MKAIPTTANTTVVPAIGVELPVKKFIQAATTFNNKSVPIIFNFPILFGLHNQTLFQKLSSLNQS